jgi:hypothetical protein
MSTMASLTVTSRRAGDWREDPLRCMVMLHKKLSTAEETIIESNSKCFETTVFPTHGSPRLWTRLRATITYLRGYYSCKLQNDPSPLLPIYVSIHSRRRPLLVVVVLSSSPMECSTFLWRSWHRTGCSFETFHRICVNSLIASPITSAIRSCVRPSVITA